MKNRNQLKVSETIGLTREKKLAMLVLVIVSLLVLHTPLGVSESTLYLFCFFFLCRESKKTIFVFAALILLLTTTKLLISPSTNYFMFYNSGITIFAVIITTVLTLRHKKLHDQIDNDRNRYVKELEEMLYGFS